MPSPLLYDGILYFLKTNNGHAVGLRREDRQAALPGAAARTASTRCSRRRSAPPGASTSPVATGATLVLKHGPAFEVIGKNTLDDGFDASPAIVGDTIYIRGYKSLYAIGEI